MAFASSRIGAQEAIIKPCDLCEDDENVNWFCKDCVKNLCERCKKGHLKIATCKNHHLVSILEGVAITKKNVSNMCQDHEEPFSFFCRSCEKNVCSYCLSKIHKKHDFIGIGELQSELHKKLKDALKEKMGEKEQMTKNLDAFVKYENVRGETLTQSYTTIDDRVKAIQLAAAEEGQKLKRSLATSADQQLTEVKENKRKLEAKRNDYGEEIKTIQQELTLQTVTTLNRFVKTSTSKLQSLQPMSFLIPQSHTFIVGTVNKELIRDMIGKDGSMLHVSKPSEMAEKVENSILPKLKIVSMYNLPVEKSCFSICTSPDGSVWIGGHGYVYKMSSDCSTVLHQIPARKSFLICCYMACLRSGDVVVSYGGVPYIDRFTTNGRRVEFSDLSPSKTYNVAVTNHDEVVVSVVDMLFLHTGSVVLFSKEGRQLKEIKMDSTNTIRLCIDRNGNIVTSDRESTCLTTLNRGGAILEKKPIKKHNIMQITCDNHGNILVVFESEDEKEVYLISDDGKIKRSFTIQCDIKINAICISHDNCLLILVDSKKVIIAEYLK